MPRKLGFFLDRASRSTLHITAAFRCCRAVVLFRVINSRSIKTPGQRELCPLICTARRHQSSHSRWHLTLLVRYRRIIGISKVFYEGLDSLHRKVGWDWIGSLKYSAGNILQIPGHPCRLDSPIVVTGKCPVRIFHDIDRWFRAIPTLGSENLGKIPQCRFAIPKRPLDRSLCDSHFIERNIPQLGQ